MSQENSSKTTQFRDWLITSFDKKEEDIQRLLVTIGVTKFAYICHDKDVYTKDDIERLDGKDGKGKEIKEGDKKDPHWHIFFHTTGKFTPSKMCSIWEEPSCHVDHVKLPNKALRYLVHTKEFSPKIPYPSESVKTNIKDFEKIVKASLESVGEEESEYLEVLQLIRDNGFLTYSALLDYIAVFKPSLIKVAVDKSFAFKSYIKETSIDHSNEDLLDRIVDLTKKCRYLLSRLECYEGKADLPENIFPKTDWFTGDPVKSAI